MSEPFDLDALAVEQEEAEPFRFTWGGKTFELPTLLQLPLDRQLQIAETGADLAAVRLVLGEKMIAELSRTPGGPGHRPMSAPRMMKLLEAWFAHQGTSRGKSPASSRSSASTATRSKPTSRSTRARRTS